MSWVLERRRFLQICAGLFAARLCSASDVRLEGVAVESSLIAKVGYAKDTRLLEIEFRSGALYRYRQVPEPTYLALMSAVSKGRYFSNNIRGKFTYELIRPLRP